MFQASGTKGEAGPTATLSDVIACESAGHGAAMCDLTRQVALTGVRWCFAGFETSGIVGMTGSGCVSATFDCARRNPACGGRTSRQVYAAGGRVCNINPMRYGLHKRVRASTVERRRNATGTGHSGNSARLKTGETPPSAGQCDLPGRIAHCRTVTSAFARDYEATGGGRPSLSCGAACLKRQ